MERREGGCCFEFALAVSDPGVVSPTASRSALVLSLSPSPLTVSETKGRSCKRAHVSCTPTTYVRKVHVENCGHQRILAHRAALRLGGQLATQTPSCWSCCAGRRR
jgi:hypothetical protein